MKYRTAGIGAVVAVLLVGGAAACGDGDDKQVSPELTGREGVSSTQSPQTPTAYAPPRLAVGQTIHISTSPAEMANPVPAGIADVTLVDLDVTKSLSTEFYGVTKADPGEQIVVWTIKVKNTGPDEFDLYPLTDAQRWTSSGHVTQPHDVSTDDSFVNQPEPRPGQTVTGSDAASVPDQDGTLEFDDRQGVPMFEIAVTR
ncbi:hypothetical protein [Streptomyces massasporeus]|uniref:hypothetical protein n=1 Tax=Streptomyces massasporeus TaxID=67324 RepID=UPI0016751554|nr:hypothetical protein [Streptomyces massasporeus]GGV90688.1 hypothetical protein GCM10010228_79570 [Streptomyces massasporeus]